MGNHFNSYPFFLYINTLHLHVFCTKIFSSTMAKHYSVNPFALSLLFSVIIFSFFLLPGLSQRETYIVYMDSTAMPKPFSTHHSWHLATLSSLSADSEVQVSTSKLLYSYTHVMSGFSAHLTLSELEALKNSPGYISSIKDIPGKPDTTRSTTFLGLDSNSGAWKVSNYGEGMIIGMVDSGVWPESESFSDKGMPKVPKRWKGVCESGQEFNSSLCNNKIIGARIFNKGLIAKWNVTVSMNSTRDNVGHGSHTASTAAGNFVENASYFGYATGTTVGVAPRAHLAIYKALWEEGTYISDVIAAIDQAIIDGVDVLSISLSFYRRPLYLYPMSVATFAAMEKNIFVSVSGGNDGSFLGKVTNDAPWVLTVAAGTIDRELQAVLKLGNGVSVTGQSLYPGSYPSKPTTIVDKGDCFNITNDIDQKIIICRDGALEDEFEDIGDENVTGVIFIMKYPRNIDEYLPTRFPVIFVSPKDGETIINYTESSKKPVATMEFGKTKLGIKGAPSLSGYSSRGPSLTNPTVMKPDIMAPGTFILAAWPAKTAVESTKPDPDGVFGNFSILYGTSMACPHAAGVAALLKKAHPDWSTAAIRSAMMTTADILDNTFQPIKDTGSDNEPATPLGMGSGQINPNKALDPGLVYETNTSDYINLLCALNLTQQQIQMITKLPNNDCSSPSLDLNYPSFIGFFNNESEPNPRKVVEFRRTLTNVGDGAATYTANLAKLNHGLNVSIVPKKLEFRRKNQKLSFKLVIEGPRKVDQGTVFGFLSWVEANGGHIVKSPVVVFSLDLDDLGPDD